MNRPLALLIVLSSVGAITLIVAGSPGTRAGSAPASLGVIINEVAWSGTTHSDDDKWIEIYNNAGTPVDLDGWTLEAVDGSPSIDLHGIIPAHGFFLLERGADDTISDTLANLIYTGVLQNPGDGLILLDDSGTIVDTANGDGGPWPGGTISPRYSMERVDPTAPGDDANWGTNDGLTRNGLDGGNNAINGTPGAPNSAWILPGADSGLDKRAPETILPGATITYTIALSNAGSLPARAARLTDVLPARVGFLTHTAPYTFHQLTTRTLVWELGTIPTSTAGSPITFSLIGQVEATAAGILVNVVTATAKSDPVASHDAAFTAVDSGPVLPSILIEALYYDGYAYGDDDEAFRLLNPSAETIDIGGWQVTDRVDGTGGILFPPGVSLAPSQALWCTRSAIDFEEQFGFEPDFETVNTDLDVPDLDGSWPTFANLGDACILKDAGGKTVDALVYNSGLTAIPGWQGPAVEPWSPNNYFGVEGQILYRKRDQVTGLPLADTDTAADWAQDPSDQVSGRKARYPGWD